MENAPQWKQSAGDYSILVQTTEARAKAGDRTLNCINERGGLRDTLNSLQIDTTEFYPWHEHFFYSSPFSCQPAHASLLETRKRCKSVAKVQRLTTWL